MSSDEFSSAGSPSKINGNSRSAEEVTTNPKNRTIGMNAAPSPETFTNSNTSPFQEHYNNQRLVPPKDKIRLILACCVGGIIENVSIDVIKEKSPL